MLMVTTTVRLEHESADEHWLSTLNLLTWSTGFIATPRVLGQELRLTANLCFARDASVEDVSNQIFFQDPSVNILSIGLSVLPPPATIPIIPRAPLGTTFFAPLGSFTLVLPSSGLCPTTVM